MSKDFEEYAKALKEKVENIYPTYLHIMNKKGNMSLEDELLSAINELKVFEQVDLADFQNYEKWLEENSGANQER